MQTIQLAKQQPLIQRSPAEIEQLKNDLARFTAAFIKLEEEKRLANKRWNDELKDYWQFIRNIEAALREE